MLNYIVSVHGAELSHSFIFSWQTASSIRRGYLEELNVIILQWPVRAEGWQELGLDQDGGLDGALSDRGEADVGSRWLAPMRVWKAEWQRSAEI